MGKGQKREERILTPGVIVVAVLFAAGLLAWPIYTWNATRTHSAERLQRKSAQTPPNTATKVAVLGGKLVFSDVSAQSREFIGYYSTIRLTAEQEAIKKEVLAAMPAACCKDSNAYTCCCPCNLSKSVWGLSNYVLTRHAATADQLRQIVRAWYDYTNPSGYSGDSCYTGGCGLAPHENGCGGMSESAIVM